MRIAFLTEASPEIGLGHVTRCGVLAAECRRRGADVEFWCDTTFASELVTRLGVGPCFDRPRSGMDWVVWDMRDPRSAAEAEALRDFGDRLLLLDELGSARLAADVVVDALMTPARAAHYEESPCVDYRFGLEYVLLDAQKLKNVGPAADRSPLIAFGGSDPQGLGVRFLDELARQSHRSDFTLVAGLRNPDLPQLCARAQRMGGQVVEYAPNLPELIAKASIVVTKLGITTFEAFALGVPCVLLEPTPAHALLAQQLEAHHAPWPAWNFGLVDEESTRLAALRFGALVSNPSDIREKSARARELVDLDGAARVADILIPRK